MSSFKVQGKYLGAGRIQEIGDKGFKARVFWVDLSGKYPNTPQFKLNGDPDIYMVDGLNKGDDVEVSFNISGKKVKGKTGKDIVFTELVAWKVVVFKRAASPVPIAANRDALLAEAAALCTEDLPF